MKKSKKSVKINKSFFLKILAWVFVIGFTVNAVAQQPVILQNKKVIESLEEQISYEKKKGQEVDALKEKVNTDEYIEKVARDKLGLVKENEKIFIDIAAQ